MQHVIATRPLLKKRYETRLATFQRSTWSRLSNLAPSELALSGFMCTTSEDMIVTAFCTGCGFPADVNWLEGTVSAMHSFAVPSCKFNNITSVALEEQYLKHMITDQDARLSTFFYWPYEHIVSAHDLAAAGFFYTKREDCVECAYCGIQISDWKPWQLPDQEHRKVNASCSQHFDAEILIERPLAMYYEFENVLSSSICTSWRGPAGAYCLNGITAQKTGLEKRGHRATRRDATRNENL